MAEYINIRGQSIEVVASDPANPTIGQIWYNSTSNTLKGGGATAAGAWATGNNMNTARFVMGNAGTQTAALAFGGYITTAVADTEEYNGSSWTTSTALSGVVESLRGVGTQTAALAFGGQAPIYSPIYSRNTEAYDGSTWTQIPATPFGARSQMMAGTQTAALGAGGYDGTLGVNITTTKEWDGSTWTTVPATLSTPVHGGYGCGTQTAAIAFGGYVFSPPAPALGATNATQLYDGTSWTAAGNINTGRHSLAGSAAGSQTAASAFGGNTGSPTGATELYDGSTWSSDTNLSTAREHLAGAGTQTAGLAFGGSPPITAATEEFTGAGSPLTVTITAS
jgi:hypothetical protein